MDKFIIDPFYYINSKNMLFKGGGGYDTSGMERATEEATALQREIHEKTQQDIQPWYDVGVSGLGRLADLMGLSGGSMQSRDQVYDELMPQYTTQTTTGGEQGNWVVAPDGTLIDATQEPYGAASGYYSGLGSEDDANFKIQQLAGALGDTEGTLPSGFSRMGAPSTTTDTTDYEGLNAAIEERLASQGGETPEGYGSLLERFGMEQFEEDPSYQYRQDESQKALERMMSAQGVTLGGGGEGEINPQVARALQEQSQNLASMEYGNAYNRYGADQQNIYNRLTGVSGMGSGAATQVADAGQNYATNVGNLQTGLASAQQQAAAAEASQPSMFSQILGTVAPIAIGAMTGGAGLGLGAFGGGAAASGASNLAGIYGGGGSSLPIGIGGTSYLY